MSKPKVTLENMEKILKMRAIPVEGYLLGHDYFDQYEKLQTPFARKYPFRAAFFKNILIVEIPDPKNVAKEDR